MKLAGVERITDLLIKSGIEVNAVDNDGRTALHDSSWTGHTKIVKLLLASGAEVNKADKRWCHNLSQFEVQILILEHLCSGKTPLHLAAINDQLATAELLIRNGATVNVQDNAQKTPLLLAMNNGTSLHLQDDKFSKSIYIFFQEIRTLRIYSLKPEQPLRIWSNMWLMISQFYTGLVKEVISCNDLKKIWV